MKLEHVDGKQLLKFLSQNIKIELETVSRADFYKKVREYVNENIQHQTKKETKALNKFLNNLDLKENELSAIPASLVFRCE